ncbi:MAG: FtsH protease activity modulator HflK [Pseudomonadales bacterium]|nr:FtsH protease activity modulator HflK [Pseudomonadales bacterium]
MAWNEPGDGKDKDPWGSRGGDQGPPDLDEAFRKLQQKLNGMFGSGGSGGSGGGSGVGLSLGSIGALIFIGLIIYGGFGFYTVDQQYRGVVLRLGKALPDIVPPGLHWNAPIVDVVHQVNVTRVRTLPHRTEMLSGDANIVDVSITVQYVVDNPKDFVVNVRAPERSLGHATESALRHAVGSASMDEVLTEGRARLAIEVKSRLQRYLNVYGTGLLVSTVNVEETAPPGPVKAAFDDVQKAKEDEETLVNEADAYLQSVVPIARGDAARQIEEASAYRDQVIAESDGETQRFLKLLKEYKMAPEVTRTRLYIDGLEKVLSNTSKVMVDVEGGNNMLYLPLDKMVSSGTGTGSFSNDQIRRLADRVLKDVNSRVPANRGRDGR